MKVVVLVFSGFNCDCDFVVVLECVGVEVLMVWYKESELFEGVDFVGVSGGFLYGDYLWVGVIVGNFLICKVVVKYVEVGGFVFGVCNGFQILIEMGFLSGVLCCNVGFKYICCIIGFKVEIFDIVFIVGYIEGDEIQILIVYYDGNYFVDDEMLVQFWGEVCVVFIYIDNLNGFVVDIVGVLFVNKCVFGMMLYLECVFDVGYGGIDGLVMFSVLME